MHQMHWSRSVASALIMPATRGPMAFASTTCLVYSVDAMFVIAHAASNCSFASFVVAPRMATSRGRMFAFSTASTGGDDSLERRRRMLTTPSRMRAGSDERAAEGK